jgi:hypothetical protein
VWRGTPDDTRADLIQKALDADRLDGMDSTGVPRARTAAPGELMTAIFDPATTTSGINRDGFELSVSCDPGTCILEGTYAVRAP